jgi:carboxyl-terminal processing protease
MKASNQSTGVRAAVGKFFRNNWIWMVVLVTTLMYAPLAGYTAEEKARQHSLDTLAEIMGLLQRNTVEPPTPKQITHASIQGMLHTLDPHSNYMDESEFRHMREDQRGSFFGIGSIIQQQPEGIVIVSTIRGGPSEKAGIRPGDYFREIDGKNTEGWTSAQAVEKLRGEKGTVVEVAIQRMGVPDLLRFSLTRAEIPSNSVTFAFMLTPSIGFIAIKDFGETTSSEFERAVLNLKKQGMKQLLLDLRDNGGGILDAALGISQQLLGPNELIVSQKGRGGRDAGQTRTPKGAALDPFPMVILINRGSASASEIVTGAVQDHDRGLVVGTTSWGKGLVQSVITIGRSRGLLLTSARYYTPSGRSIQRDYQHGLDDYFLPEDEKGAAVPKGPEYKTDLNRIVYGGGGITPDYYVDQTQLSAFTATLRGRHAAFFKFAIQEKEKVAVKPQQDADDALMTRFKAFLMEQKIPITDVEWTDPENQTQMRRQVAYELQNVAFGTEAGFRYLCKYDPQVNKAMEVMPEADSLLKKKLLSLQTPENPNKLAVKR